MGSVLTLWCRHVTWLNIPCWGLTVTPIMNKISLLTTLHNNISCYRHHHDHLRRVCSQLLSTRPWYHSRGRNSLRCLSPMRLSFSKTSLCLVIVTCAGHSWSSRDHSLCDVFLVSGYLPGLCHHQSSVAFSHKRKTDTWLVWQSSRHSIYMVMSQYASVHCHFVHKTVTC